MDRVLCGLETEYGLAIEGRGPETQIEDALEFVNCCPIPGFLGWDNRFENPRADMRGFSVAHLAVDPEDAKFDRPGRSTTDSSMRGDRVLVTGGRFYNDHGHPEYATPECWDPMALAHQDSIGEYILRETAEAYEHRFGRKVAVYKNNTDFHGASYGTHESYLVPRSIPLEILYKSITPLLIARMIVCGAGKVGSESGDDVRFQLSQRADFFVEPLNVETLFRRPIFNTRDEPHADPNKWRRLHVIATDANRRWTSNWTKIAIIQAAIRLAAIGEVPQWELSAPVGAIQRVSRDFEKRDFEIELVGGTKTNAYAILETLLTAAERCLNLNRQEQKAADGFRQTLEALQKPGHQAVIKNVEWASKLAAIEVYRDAMDLKWGDPALQAADLSFSQIWGEESLLEILAEDLGIGDEFELNQYVEHYGRLNPPREFRDRTRATARALAIQKFPDQLENVCWRRLTFKDQELELRPEIEYPRELEEAQTVEQFVEIVNNAQ